MRNFADSSDDDDFPDIDDLLSGMIQKQHYTPDSCGDDDSFVDEDELLPSVEQGICWDGMDGVIGSGGRRGSRAVPTRSARVSSQGEHPDSQSPRLLTH